MPKVTVNLSGLLNLNQLLQMLAAGKFRVQVGIFGGRNARKKGSMTNAQVGFIQEMGSMTMGIPRRSWLEYPLKSRSDHMVKQAAPKVAEAFKNPSKGSIKRFLKEIGIAAEAIIEEAFASRGWGTWKPNRPATIARKGSDSPLIDEGELRRAVASRVVG